MFGLCVVSKECVSTQSLHANRYENHLQHLAQCFFVLDNTVYLDINLNN